MLRTAYIQISLTTYWPLCVFWFITISMRNLSNYDIVFASFIKCLFVLVYSILSFFFVFYFSLFISVLCHFFIVFFLSFYLSFYLSIYLSFFSSVLLFFFLSLFFFFVFFCIFCFSSLRCLCLLHTYRDFTSYLQIMKCTLVHIHGSCLGNFMNAYEYM